MTGGLGSSRLVSAGLAGVRFPPSSAAGCLIASMHTTLISPRVLANHLDDPGWVIVDCRFSLADTEQGRRDYAAAHVPGAVYAHLDEDLAGAVLPGRDGRHPLPEIASFAQKLTSWGVHSGIQVVAYDDSAGMIAARLWWMLRWLGHDAVAVLDGGWQGWLAAGFPLANLAADAGRSASRAWPAFSAQPRPEMLASLEQVEAMSMDERARRLFDSRTAERYRGEQEPIDPVAGRIPGARNAPHPLTSGEDGLFRSPQELQAYFGELLGELQAAQAVFYCGSGVSACRNLLALVHAGLGDGKLYAGSWSEWIANPARPVERD